MEQAEQFELIIVDSTDYSVGSAWTAATYRHIRALMRPEHSVLMANADTPFLSSAHLTPAVRLLAPLFEHVHPLVISQPEFVTGHYSFVFCSATIDPLDHGKIDWQGAWEAAAVETEYYNAEVHRAVFALPEFLRRAVEAARRGDGAAEAAAGGGGGGLGGFGRSKGRGPGAAPGTHMT